MNILIGIGHLMNMQGEELKNSQQGSEMEDSHSYSMEGWKMHHY